MTQPPNTTTIDLTPNYGAIFNRMTKALPGEVKFLITQMEAEETFSVMRDYVLDNSPQEFAEYEREKVTARLGSVNSVLYTIANALNTITQVSDIETLREAVNKALADVNEAHRKSQEEE